MERGDLEEAIQRFDSALPLLMTRGDAATVGMAHMMKSHAVGCTGRFADMAESCREALEYARSNGQPFYVEHQAVFLSMSLYLRGDFEEFDSVIGSLSGEHSHSRGLLAASRSINLGRFKQALAELPEPALVGGIPALLAFVHAPRARLAWVSGDVDDEQAELGELKAALEATDTFPEASMRGFESCLASLDDAILSPATKQSGVLELLAERLGAGEVAFNVACVPRVRGMLHEALGRLDEAAAAYARALDVCRTSRAPLEEGRSGLQLALLERKRGNERLALDAVVRAIPLLERSEAPFYLDQAVSLRMELQGLADIDVTTSIDAVAASLDAERPDLSPQAAPDGTVTLLFSDIENSTARTAELGDAKWMEVLREHNVIVRDQLAAHGGYEVKSMGDGFMLAFGSALDGLRCAIGMQRAFAERNAQAEEAVRVRIGLHTGEAIKEADDFFGSHVNLAARVGGAAKGEEILVSSLLKALTESAGEFRFDEGREVELKGISGAQRVHAVEWR